MSETILIKQYPAIQLAHLYEHLFCRAVDKLFYDRGLFPYLDYSLTGNIHQTGIIFIKLETYTAEATDLSHAVDSIKLSLTAESLSLAASQLIAENEFAYITSGIDEVRRHLKILDGITWREIDSITSIDTRGIKRLSRPFYIDINHPLPAKKLSLVVAVDGYTDHNFGKLLPLIRLLSFLISDTYETVLSDKYGLYPIDGEFSNSPTLTGYKSLFNIPDGHSINKNEVLETVSEVIKYISINKGFERFAEVLKDISYKHASKVAPNALYNLTDTRILMGSRGWQEIASKSNIEMILNSLTLSARTGRDRVAQKFTIPL